MLVLFLSNAEIAILCSLKYECLDLNVSPVVKTVQSLMGNVCVGGGFNPDWGS